MAPKPTRSFLISSLLIVFVLTLFPAPVQARDSKALPTLEEFREQVKNGNAKILRGVYIPELLAAWVTQQPADDPGFVSAAEDTLTQFQLASRFGSTGLLAHNYLAGADFSQLTKGQVFHLIYGDGKTKAFIVTETLRFRALRPNSPTSNFIDLEDGTFLTAVELMTEVYNRPGDVILQTCISANGNESWGRLFVIAEPYEMDYTMASFGGA
jgi:hypothetical protein